MRKARTEPECIAVVVDYLRDLFSETNRTISRKNIKRYNNNTLLSPEYLRLEMSLLGKYAKYGGLDTDGFHMALRESKIQYLVIDNMARVLGLCWSDEYIRLLHSPLESCFRVPTAQDVVRLQPEARVAVDLTGEAERVLQDSLSLSHSSLDDRDTLYAQLLPADVPRYLLRQARVHVNENRFEEADRVLARFMQVTGNLH